MSRKYLTAIAFTLLTGWLLMGAGGEQVPAAEAHSLVQSGAKLIDVRTPEEFAEGHVKEAVNIPVQDLQKRLSEVGARDKPVVVYCRSGHRSHQAAEILRGAGFTRVYDLGAMSRWQERP